MEECTCAMTEASLRACAVHGEKSTEAILARWERQQAAQGTIIDNVPETAIEKTQYWWGWA